MAEPHPAPATTWDEPVAPAMPTRLRVLGLPRYTEFDVALRRIREMLTIIILAVIVVLIVFSVVAGWSIVQGLSSGTTELPAQVPMPTPSG